MRRGPKGYFKDSRLAYLERNLPAYNVTTKGNRNNFWHKFYTGWWQRSPGNSTMATSHPRIAPVRWLDSGVSHLAKMYRRGRSRNDLLRYGGVFMFADRY